MLSSLAAMAGWQGSAGQGDNVVQLSGYYRRGPSLPARAFAQGSSQRIVFLCVYVSAVLPARALIFSIRTFVFPAWTLVGEDPINYQYSVHNNQKIVSHSSGK